MEVAPKMEKQMVKPLQKINSRFQELRKSNLAGAFMAGAMAIIAVVWVLLQAFGLLGHAQTTDGARLSRYLDNNINGVRRVLLVDTDNYDYLNIPKIDETALNASINYGVAVCDRISRLEANLINAGIALIDATPTQRQYLYASPVDDALDLQYDADVVTKASMYLVQHYCQRYGLSDETCARFVSTLKLQGTAIGQSCASNQKVSCRTNAPYRTIDGTCNNADNPKWGSALTAYSRVLFPAYQDGIQLPRRASKNHKILPGSRLLSSTLSQTNDQSDVSRTLAVMQWSQFIAHDMAHTVVRKMVATKQPISCCSSDGSHLLPRHLHPDCAEISIPEEDPVYGKYQIRCMNYVRSLPVVKSDCSFGPIEQMNQVTHFLDGSTIYGANDERAEELRSFNGGKLQAVRRNGFDYLPNAENISTANACESPERCYKSGDDRVNFEPHLALMHTIWLREHNRIANKLSEINPHWSDEKLYQEARRIVIAEIQHITYKEWLPMVLGRRYVRTLGLSLPTVGNRYVPEEDPSVTNEASTAVFRFINSLKQGYLSMTDDHRHANGSLKLSDYFYNPRVIEKDNIFDSLLRGMTTQTSSKMDSNVVADMTQRLYKTSNNALGLDIISLDIQRGRDHGLPGYNYYRKYCGLAAAKKFNDFLDYIPQETVNKLKHIYDDPQDVDLLVGGMAEKPADDGLLGPTFRCLLSEQLAKTRWTDRYFYDSLNQPYALTNEQLNEIRSVTLARIFCDNSNNIERMQPNAFIRLQSESDLASCTDFEAVPSVDLYSWAERAKAYR